MSESCELPAFDRDAAAALARRLFGLDGPVSRLDGERDLNLRIGRAGSRHVFKIANAEESRRFLECQHRVFERIAAARVFPRAATACPSRAGRPIETVRSASGRAHLCRALPYLEGRLLAEVRAPGSGLLEDLGAALARLDRALEGFHDPALERPLLWRLERGADIVAETLPTLVPGPRRKLLEQHLARYRRHTAPRLAGLRRALIHNDANRNNVLVDAAAERVVGIIDFGDMAVSLRVGEAAIAATYAMLDRADPWPPAAAVVRGYHREWALDDDEIAALPGLVRLRACMSAAIGLRQAALQPDNTYLAIDSDAVWALLESLAGVDDAAAAAALAPR